MRAILQTTSPERYWNVFRNLLWAKSSVFIEHQHPMVAGLFRRKERRSRRAGFAPESWWAYHRRRWTECGRKAAAWVALILEMEEVWLQTRKRTETERVLWEEIRRIRHDALEWRHLHTRQLQQAYRQTLARLGRSRAPTGGPCRIPSQFTLFCQRMNILSDRVLYSRAALRQFWAQTRADLRQGRLGQLRPIRAVVHLLQDLALAVHFASAFLASGIR
jgi:hypothetical protein